MPRRARVHLEGGIFHVYNRVARGAEVFVEPGEGERFLELLRFVRDRDDFSLLAWVLMSNHYHLAVRTGPVPLARTMGYLQGRFGQGYNRPRDLTGPLWQSRYKAKLVEDPRYFRSLIAYIHLNPVAAGLVDDPVEHRFSGHRELVRRTPTPLIAVDEVLAEFGDTLRAARACYVRCLRAEREAAWFGERPGWLPWWRREPDRPLEPAPPEASVDALGYSSGLERAPLAAPEFLRRVCSALAVTGARIAGAGQDREVSRLRYLLGAVAIERWGVQAKNLGEVLGRRPEVVTRWAARGAQLRQTDAAFRDAYKRLDRALAASCAGIADTAD